MRILIVGGGGREHAIAWKIARDRPEAELLLAPGNEGSARLGRQLAVGAEDVPALLGTARAERVDLTVVGSEGPLAAGIADAFQAADLRIFGPTAAAAQIEASKAWAKGFMRRHGIPTARYGEFANAAEAEDHIRSWDAPPVVKDDALVGGKGVTVAASTEQAVEAARAIFAARPNARVVVEERLEGYEVSAHLFCDGRDFSLMPFACDYKRLLDSDAGPNTGGMGVYAPPAISDGLKRRIVDEIVAPTIAGLAAEGRPFTGVLYPGLMLTPDGPKVLEYNCRFGDPETEALLPLLESDLLDLMEGCVEGRLAEVKPRWSSKRCCAVVLASPGYPDHPQPAAPTGWESLPEAVAFRGGASGRVLTVSALGASLDEARKNAYSAVSQVDLPGGHYRRDIGASDRAAVLS